MKTRTKSIRSAPARLPGKAAASMAPRGAKGKTLAKAGSSRGISTAGAGSRGGSPATKGGATAASSRRKFVVFVSLVGLLSLTSVLLLALAPAPLTQGSAASLFALDQRASMDAVFETGVPVAKGRWRSIFVHHSKTTTGNADTLAAPAGGLADHFVIGNGAGCVDGELQLGHRWSSQLPAGEVPGTQSIAADCISICLVGDLDRGAPTPTQRLRLTQLVHTLQSRLGVGADRVYLHQGTHSAADIGDAFPVKTFREQLLP